MRKAMVVGRDGLIIACPPWTLEPVLRLISPSLARVTCVFLARNNADSQNCCAPPRRTERAAFHPRPLSPTTTSMGAGASVEHPYADEAAALADGKTQVHGRR